MNPYKNGRRSRTIMSGLPHENPDRIQQCTEQYLDELQPRDAAELDLVHQMARLSLAVERAERMEIAHMTERVNQATKEPLEEPAVEQRKVVGEGGGVRVPPRGDDPRRSSMTSKPLPWAAAGCWSGGRSTAPCSTAT